MVDPTAGTNSTVPAWTTSPARTGSSTGTARSTAGSTHTATTNNNATTPAGSNVRLSMPSSRRSAGTQLSRQRSKSPPAGSDTLGPDITISRPPPWKLVTTLAAAALGGDRTNRSAVPG